MTVEVSLPEIRRLEYAAGQLHEGLNQHGTIYLFLRSVRSHQSQIVHRRQILDVLSLYTLPLMSTVSTDLEIELAHTVKEKV
jgi:midasin